jgi:alkylation response protein AidB-like acyl-CoA dehydrogenase
VTAIGIEDFRSEVREWLEEHAVPRCGDEKPAALFTEHPDEAAYVEEAKAWQRRLFEARFAGITWPEEYGGRGLGPVHQIVWTQESARYDIPVELFSIGLGMGGPTVITWGTSEQKDRWLRPMLSGEEIWCQMFSEPNAGSDVAAVQTKAEQDGEEWVVNGQKVWTSGAHYSKWGMLLARTDPDVPKHKGLTYFVIDMEQSGVEARPLRQMTGGANFTEVFFTDARVPADGVVGSPGMGWSVAITTLMNERTSIGALGGIAGASGTTALQRLTESVMDRTGDDPAREPTNRDRLAQIAIRARVLGYHSQRIIAAFAKGEIPTAEGSIAKLALTDLLERVASFGVDVQGPFGMLGGDDAIGQWEMAFLGYPGMRVAGGTDEIMRNIIGERVLDLPREPRIDRDRPFREVPKNG